ncbi:methyl-accepting chemotaxis protein [Undibacterium sp. RuRC25W]|uniref:methyl-accepting chemotaxis protein n=1 Tax=Undibacterium sp. RuRC25W TaxID=3413047 RepID=UPI003BF2B34E
MNNIKIGTRLGFGFGSIILLLIIIAFVSIHRLKSGNEKTEEIVKDRYAKIMLAVQIKGNVDTEARNLRNALLATTPEERKRFIDLAVEAAKKNAEILPHLEQVINTPRGKELFDAMADARSKYRVAAEQELKQIENGEKEKATEFLFKEVIPPQNALFGAIDKFYEFQAELMDRVATTALDQANSATILVIVLSAIAAVLASAIGIFIARSITRPLNEAVKVAQTVAAGDLTSNIEVTSTDETGQLLQALKEMNNALQDIVGQVRSGTDTIATASSQIAVGNMDLSTRTEQQASSLEETASSMEEITSVVQQNADNARQANSLAKTASEVASKGGSVVSEVVGTMSSISESAKKIVDIISVIDGIAFQTNILALNAAVEAARAGEQGRGFAVVASEVRNLAQRSASAAKEIKTLIGDSVEKVEAGSKLVDLAGTTMTEVVDSVRRVTDVISEISAAGQEQSTGIEQINIAITEMDNLTQQNAALVEEAAAAAGSLQDQAENLAQLVSVFKIHGASSSSVKLNRPTQHSPAISSTVTKVASKNSMDRAPKTVQLVSKSTLSTTQNDTSEWETF